jgi:hypothetical protein
MSRKAHNWPEEDERGRDRCAEKSETRGGEQKREEHRLIYGLVSQDDHYLNDH